MVEIGAGGGSLAHVDTMGRIAVGPESAGADPGPACYGRGGTRAGGDRCEPAARPLRCRALRRRHDAAGQPRRAHDALVARGRRARWGSTAEMAALGVVEMVDENMANAARVHAIESRQDLCGAHADRVRRRRAGACLPGGGEDRHRPRAGAVRRRRRQRHRLPARAGRLRGGAQPVSAVFHASTSMR